MLSTRVALRPLAYTPLIIGKRWRTRNLPTQTYEKFEQGDKVPVKTSIVNTLAFLHRKDLFEGYKEWKKFKRFEEMHKDQKYLPDRHKTLGPDLATTHFITVRGGKIKFIGNDKWTTKEDVEQLRVPNIYIPGYYVEEIDASEMDILFEGFDNMCSLVKLKKLHLRNCKYIDDWCLSRTHLFSNTLEYLDISGCHSVTERGICTLHPLRNLKTLVINDNPNIQNKELVSLLLQEIIPQCEVVGVQFDDPILLKRLENFMH